MTVQQERPSTTAQPTVPAVQLPQPRNLAGAAWTHEPSPRSP